MTQTLTDNKTALLATALKEGLHVTASHYGKQYQCRCFGTDDRANSFMEANPEYGVLFVEDESVHAVYVAKLTDIGVIQ